MQEPQQEASGDYGYDLAHDDVQPGQGAEPAVRREAAAPAKPPGAADLAGDLGYDEAHGF